MKPQPFTVAGAALALAAAAACTATPAPADVKNGEAVYGQCAACHSLNVDRTGPHHCGLLERRAGSVPGFAYSDALRRSKIVWTPRTLDQFLANPLKMVPGTTMGYAGVTDVKARRDLISYLQAANSSAECADTAQAK